MYGNEYIKRLYEQLCRPVSVELVSITNMELLHVFCLSDNLLVAMGIFRVPVQLVRGDILQLEDQLSCSSNSGYNFLGVFHCSQEY